MTHSPDEDFVVDRIGNVVVGSGTSGHGFKFGPLFGEWLADLGDGEGWRARVRTPAAVRAEPVPSPQLGGAGCLEPERQAVLAAGQVRDRERRPRLIRERFE